MTASVTITARRGATSARIEATRVVFSPHQCFAFDDRKTDIACLEALGTHLSAQPGLAIYRRGPLFDYLLKHVPGLAKHVVAVISDDWSEDGAKYGQTHCLPNAVPNTVKTVFLCETRSFPRMQMRKRLSATLKLIEPDVLKDLAADIVPVQSWSPIERNIYPTDIPEIEFPSGLDVILMDCPARNLALMPNGLAYVHNALKSAEVTSATFDLDVITYHRFHIRRLFDEGGKVVLPSGRVLPIDPWQAEHYDLWSDQEVIDYFMPIIEEAAAKLIEAKPKILGLSVQQCSEAYSRRLVELVREGHPDVLIVVGGFSCYNADIGLKSFPEADYMCIGESDLTVGPLIEALARGERPRNLPGVKSHIDDPTIPFMPAPMPHNLSNLEYPKYEWFDLDVYRNYNDYQLTPIIASRGCRWSRCTFCAERFYWRIRDPKEFADEVEWLASQGCTLFMFNESDLNGMPEMVLEICDEIIRRDLNVKLTGQLRIHKKSNRAYFDKLKEAGFVALRFGVDAFSANTLRLQKKGYTPEMVSQNLKDCWEAGIFTEVNWVIGVPGETEADIDEGIELILQNRDYIGRLANINPLILVNGGVYWIDPPSHNIVFREPREELYAKHPKVIPADLWYSTEPYIDGQVRKERFERIVIALHDAGFPVGDWAARVIEDVKYARDRNRAGGAKSSAAQLKSDDEKDADAIGAVDDVTVTAARQESEDAATVKGDGIVGSEAPRLVRQLENHNIVFYKGLYYALPKALGDVDLTRGDVRNEPGVIINSDETSVLAEIELVSKWADSRGHFDAQEKQRKEGTYLRANSRLGDSEAAQIAERPFIAEWEGAYYAIGRGALDDAFTFDGASVEPAPNDWLAAPSKPKSAWHRAFNLLPSGARAEIRRTIIAELSGQDPGSRATPSGADLVRTAATGLSKRLRTQGVGSLFGRTNAARQGQVLPGSDLIICNIVSQSATPDLLRTLGTYNLVQFDGKYYGVPHGAFVDWQDLDPDSIPGLIIAATAREATQHIEQAIGYIRSDEFGKSSGDVVSGPAGEFYDTPQLIESVGDYNIVGYEGWIYGVPKSTGHLDLTEVDVTEMPGVIKDVSRDVVIDEIDDIERMKEQHVVAAE